MSGAGGFFRTTALVSRKELKDGLRDWRSVLSALLYPLLGPAMIYLSFLMMEGTTKVAEEIDLPVVGAENAPELISWLERHEATILPPPESPRDAVREDDCSVVLSIPDDYGEKIAEGRPVVVELIFDGSRAKSLPAVQRARRLIEQFSSQHASLRLLARGINPQLATPLVIADTDVAGQSFLLRQLLMSVPMLILLAAFICGMQISIDTTAGERERGSLEPLLINPVPRSAIVSGKWLAAVAFSGFGLLVAMIGCFLVLARLPLQELGFRLDLGSREWVGVFVATLPVAPMAMAIQLLLATFARSFKEAQTYVSIVMFVPVVLGLYGTIYPLRSAPWMAFVPALSQQVLITDIMRGESPAMWVYLAAAASALAVAAVCVVLTARLFANERIVFSR